MLKQVTEGMVLLYVTNHLSAEERRLVEEEFQTNLQVQSWFVNLDALPDPVVWEEENEQLAFTATDLRRQTSIDTPGFRRVVATTYLSAERDVRNATWAAWRRYFTKNGKPTNGIPAEIVPSQLFSDDEGTLLCRHAVPETLVGDNQTNNIAPWDFPCILPDYVSGLLTIRQLPELVPSGIVDVFAVRQRGHDEVEVFQPQRVPLEFVKAPNGEQYWYADIPLKSLIGEFQPGDDFIYCVEAVKGP